MENAELVNITKFIPLGKLNGIDMVKNSKGNKYIIKKYKKGNEEQLAAELNAQRIYRALGADIPYADIDKKNNTIIIPYIDGKLLKNVTAAEQNAAKDELKKGFVLDALLGNIDVIGENEENIILPKGGGPPIRYNIGGVYIFRTNETKKPFTEKVSEIDTMRDAAILPHTAKYFGDITEHEINEQIKDVILPNVALIMSIVDGKYESIIKKRIDNLVARIPDDNNRNHVGNNNNSPSPINLSDINDHIVPRLGNIGKNIEYDVSFNKTKKYNANIPLNTAILSSVDLRCIKFYSRGGDELINPFLHSTRWRKIHRDRYGLVDAFTEKYPKLPAESDEDYNNKLLYYFFVNLYNAIQKGISPKITTPFIVYRGVKSTYLKLNKDKYYYINAFTSTTTEISLAEAYGTVFDYNHSRSVNLYVFYVHPLCRYMNIKPVSEFKAESEILLAPYHRYYYVGAEVNKSVFKHKYVILPTDLDIPSRFEDFMTWKKTITAMSKPGPGPPPQHKNGSPPKKGPLHSGKKKALGGRAAILNTIIPRNYTINTKLSKNKLIRINRKNKTRKINSANSVNNTIDEYDRFTEHLPSFPGKAPTQEELVLINKIVQFFEGNK